MAPSQHEQCPRRRSRNQTKAVIVGASVTLTNTATNVSSRTVTNETGFYLFAVPIREQARLRFNADFFNVLNHRGNPAGVAADGVLDMRASGTAARVLQLTLRLI